MEARQFLAPAQVTIEGFPPIAMLLAFVMPLMTLVLVFMMIMPLMKRLAEAIRTS